MHAKIRQLAIGLAIGGWVSALGCSGDSVTAPSTGSLEITTTTSGPEPDADGYTLAIDGGAEVAIALNATHREESLEPGTHSIRLAGMAANCTVEGDNPRSVSVQAGANAAVGFTINCGATSGTLAITVATSGPSPDPDGYTVTVDGAERGTVAASGVISLEGVTQGDHQVGLNGLAGNCQVQGDNPRTTTVLAGANASAAFEVVCAAAPPNAGTLRITTTTTGGTPDPDGYAFAIDGGSSQPIGVNATATSTNLAAGSHSVRLSQLAGNCSVSGVNPRLVTVATGATAQVGFAVVCTVASGSIQITTSTTGGSPDPDGYTVAVDNAAPKAIGVNATLTVPGVSAGAHQVALAGLASNCGVTEDNPRTITVMAGASAQVGFGISCSTIQTSSRIVWVKADVEPGPDDPPQPAAWDIYAMNPDGSAPTNLTNSPGLYSFPKWSRDHTKIAFQSNHNGNFDIYVMNSDGSGQRQLTTSSARDVSADWSPDGRKLVFVSERDGNSEIYSVQVDGTGESRLTNSPASSSLGEPRWSPDGKKILFWKDFDLFVMNADGSSPTNITSNPNRRGGAVWSPDGKRIAFAGSPDATEGPLDIFVLNADGSGLTQLTDDPADDTNPLWSPDGQKIAFESLRDRSTQIYLMNVDGSNQINLTRDPQAATSPSWSSDGHKIAFVGSRDGNQEIYVMGADGSLQTRLTEDPQMDFMPDWSR